MDADERRVALAIAPGPVIYPPGTSTKRFARDMAFSATLPPPGPTLTPKQRAYLLAVAIRFRRQVPADVVALARQLETPTTESTA